ncbi:hypothetical protein Kpho02_15810 [Kitasatospora phosalacinea]|uniref:Uncharacterized protein n=1 Tax=Kitasatospora phosalacinea TaxID=2065 RepID=A0A9W6Q6Z9_9ACTN|nr:hypothetical protein [Kitasatospora phosalacinea]GLW69282.1 hypothetical protein Kpho02_15810 [Kitasatospora phosalacinea]
MRIDDLAAPRLGELWSLHEDVRLEGARAADGGALTVRDRWGAVVFERPGPVLRRVLERMSFGPVAPGNVLPGFPGLWEADRPGRHGPDVARLLRDLRRIRGSVVRSLALGGSPLLSVVPLAPDVPFAPRPAPAGRPCRLCPSAVLRRAPDGPRLEAPTARHLVRLHRAEAVRLLGPLGGPAPADAPPPAPELLRAASGYLLAARVAVLSPAPAPAPGPPGPGLPAAAVRRIGELLSLARPLAVERDGRPAPPPYRLGLYLLAAPDAHRYDPRRHRLEPFGTAPGTPPLLLVTARFRRAAHAFGGPAPARLRTDADALLHHLHPAASAAGLAPRPLPPDRADAAARALGLDWPTETGLGGFALHAPRADRPPDRPPG